MGKDVEEVVAWETTASLGILDILLLGYRITNYYCLHNIQPCQSNPQDGNDSMDEMNVKKKESEAEAKK